MTGAVNAYAFIDVNRLPEFNRREVELIERTSPLRAFGLEPDVYGVNSLGMVTSVMWSEKRKCEHCDGDGTVECSQCGHEDECNKCEGSGLSYSNQVLVTRCDGSTIIKIFNRGFAKRILECGSEESDDLIVHSDAWGVV